MDQLPQNKADMLSMIEEKVRNILELIGIGDFLNRTLLAQVLRSANNKWDLRKLKSFSKAKGIIILTMQ